MTADTTRLAAIHAAAREVDNAFHGRYPTDLTERQRLSLDRLSVVLRHSVPPPTPEEPTCTDC